MLTELECEQGEQKRPRGPEETHVLHVSESEFHTIIGALRQLQQTWSMRGLWIEHLVSNGDECEPLDLLEIDELVERLNMSREQAGDELPDTAGACPECGCVDVEGHSLNFEWPYYEQNVTCQNCGHDFAHWFRFESVGPER